MILTDLRKIVHRLSSDAAEQAWDKFASKWSGMGEAAFVEYFKSKYTAKQFCRGDVPPGYPIVGM